MQKVNNDIFSLIKRGQEGDRCALETIVQENNRLVWSVVKHFSGKGYETEDLYQIGCIGLIKAVKKFDFSKNVQFSTYAIPMIMGEIRKFLRDDGPVKVSRSIKELAHKIWYISNDITKRTGREATISEIANEIRISVEEAAMAIAAAAQPISLYQPLKEGDINEITLIDTIEAGDSFDENIIDSVTVKNATSKLPSRERDLIFMRYYQNKTQTEVAAKLGISQVQVSRLEKKILLKLRQEIETN